MAKHEVPEPLGSCRPHDPRAPKCCQRAFNWAKKPRQWRGRVAYCIRSSGPRSLSKTAQSRIAVLTRSTRRQNQWCLPMVALLSLAAWLMPHPNGVMGHACWKQCQSLQRARVLAVLPFASPGRVSSPPPKGPACSATTGHLGPLSLPADAILPESFAVGTPSYV